MARQRPNPYQAYVADWESLLRALRTTPYQISYIDSFRIELEQAVEKVRAVKARQIASQIACRQATRQLNVAMAEGKGMASRMRSYLKGRLGLSNEDLVRFGVTPIRKRGPRRAILTRTAETKVN